MNNRNRLPWFLLICFMFIGTVVDTIVRDAWSSLSGWDYTMLAILLVLIISYFIKPKENKT